MSVGGGQFARPGSFDNFGGATSQCLRIKNLAYLLQYHSRAVDDKEAL